MKKIFDIGLCIKIIYIKHFKTFQVECFLSSSPCGKIGKGNTSRVNDIRCWTSGRRLCFPAENEGRNFLRNSLGIKGLNYCRPVEAFCATSHVYRQEQR
ncbi:hypothetical protein CEXT_354071 [Caerostris extrusa]|uniref:Uncharacterized protein n=1 Tax=Caerostris extrusa TaxID=172846 RepID=A0AAV4PV37_CAEEX|nr:hypothetical protein CEXT_354071 [Caerostris extrusa]